jgi:NAD(P)-dependent dehydrogenase (short-subunit alcohol dehydrogenase family)
MGPDEARSFGEIAIVTGSTGGIGSAIAEAEAKKVLTGCKQQGVDQAMRRSRASGAKLRCVVVDLGVAEVYAILHATVASSHIQEHRAPRRVGGALS